MRLDYLLDLTQKLYFKFICGKEVIKWVAYCNYLKNFKYGFVWFWGFFFGIVFILVKGYPFF